MISLDNTKDIVKIKFAEGHSNKRTITINKDIKLKPLSQYIIDTGVFITCSKSLDECWLRCGTHIDYIFANSQRYSYKDGQKEELQIEVFNYSDKEFTLQKGTEIGSLYYSITNNNSFDEKELYATNIYNDGDLIIKCLSNEEHYYTINTDPNGKRTLVINMKE